MAIFKLVLLVLAAIGGLILIFQWFAARRAAAGAAK